MPKPPRKTKLSEFTVKNLKAEPKPFLVWDTQQSGFAVRIEPSGYRSWKCIYKHCGRKRDLHLGAVNAIGLADARKLAAKIIYEVAQGRDPAAERKAQRGANSFADLADRYLEYAKRKNRSWKQADWLVRRHLRPVWGKLAAENISRSDVRAMMTRITAMAPITANQVLASASAIFSWGVKQEIIKLNPCQGVERNPTQSRERVLSATEIPQFWKAFDESGVQGAALKVLLLTGQRPGEVSGMRREHIEGEVWTLPGAPIPALGWPGTKNGQSHRVHLSAPAQSIIAAMPPGGLVFPGCKNTIDITMRRICAKLGVPRAVPHDLRRTNGTLITSLGFTRDAMNRIQNHRDGGIASVYDRYQYSAENKHILETIAAHILALVEGREPRSNVLPFAANAL